MEWTQAKSMQHYLDIVSVLAVKDFKIRYRNSVLGFLWALLNPISYMVILTLVFSVLLRVNIPNFAAWALIALLVWRFFSVGTGQGLGSIVGNPSLVGKVYIPRWLIILSNNLANLLGSSLEFVVLLPLMVVLGINLTFYALYLPVILILEFLLIFALSLSLASLNTRYRDFNQLWDIALQLGFFLSPIVYDITLVPVKYRSLYSLNPVTQLIVSARDVLLYHTFPSIVTSGVTLLSILIFLTVGFFIFRWMESRFAEEF